MLTIDDHQRTMAEAALKKAAEQYAAGSFEPIPAGMTYVIVAKLGILRTVFVSYDQALQYLIDLYHAAALAYHPLTLCYIRDTRYLPNDAQYWYTGVVVITCVG